MNIKQLTTTSMARAALATGFAHAQTMGPSGEKPTPSKDITVSESSMGKLKGKGYKAALVWHEQSPFVVAPAITITPDNVRQGYMTSLNIKPPKAVFDNI